MRELPSETSNCSMANVLAKPAVPKRESKWPPKTNAARQIHDPTAYTTSTFQFRTTIARVVNSTSALLD